MPEKKRGQSHYGEGKIADINRLPDELAPIPWRPENPENGAGGKHGQFAELREQIKGGLAWNSEDVHQSRISKSSIMLPAYCRFALRPSVVSTS